MISNVAKLRSLGSIMMLTAMVSTSSSVFAEEAPSAAADRATSERLALSSGVRLVRFTAEFDGAIPDRGDGPHYLPKGFVTMGMGDAVIEGKAPVSSVVYSNVDGKGGFIDRGTIDFAAGKLEYEGVYPTHNDATPVPELRQTAMVQSVKGGTGAFEGATGYLLINSTLVPRGPKLTGFNGTIVGVLFLKEKH